MPTKRKHKPVKRKAVKRRSKPKVKRHTPRKVVRRRTSVETTVGRKRKPRKRKRSVKRGQRIKVVHVLAGKRKRKRSHSRTTIHRRRSHSKRRVVMAGRGRRTRSVGKKGNLGLLLAVGVGALAVYMLTRPKTTPYPNLNQLPPLTQTPNYQRNDQTNSILNYALAASLGIDAITKLINSLNSSNDDQVKQIYDQVETTGALPDTVYV